MSFPRDYRGRFNALVSYLFLSGLAIQDITGSTPTPDNILKYTAHRTLTLP
jgi:hypothetical protein